MILIAIPDDSYAAALAAFDHTIKRTRQLDAPELVQRFEKAKTDFEQAYLHAIERQADVTVPALLRRQAE